MRNLKLLASLAIACLLSGCETPTKAYVKLHPELSPEHRKIILSGRIKYGDPVAGMTKEQVRLVMGTDPDQFDSINGEDAWIWFKMPAGHNKVENDTETGASAARTSGGGGGGGGGGKHNKLDADSAPTEGKRGKTTVFFKGNLATRVEFTSGTL